MAIPPHRIALQAAPISTHETITRRSGASSLVEAGSLETMRFGIG
jgi:hypothetical protein